MHRHLAVWPRFRATLLVVASACGGNPAAAPASAPPLPKFVPQPTTPQLEAEISQITLRGLAPGSTIELVAERPVAESPLLGGQRRRYRAHASFRVDATGTLELASAAPLPGSTYQGADLRGLFWSMTASDAALPDTWPDDQVHLTATLAGHELARTTLVLHKAHPEIIVTPVGSELPGAVLARLPGDERRPAIIALGGSEGGDSFAREMAPRLASYGYAVLGLPYYAPPYGPPRAELAGLPRAFTDIPVDRLEQARAWLARQPGVDVEHLALYGGSKGAELALIAATKLPWVTAVVAIVPSDVVWEGWGVPGAAPGTRSSFAWRGEPLPFVPYHDMAGELAHAQAGQHVNLRRVQDQGRAEHPDAVTRARIPIEQFRGALLVAGGGADQVWASGEMAGNLARSRSAAGLATTALIFPAAGHLLSGDGWAPTTGVERLMFEVGGTAEANARAQAAVWRETVAFLARSLGK